MIVLSLLYGLFFAALGAFVPWMPPLLAERGFTPAAIGGLLAIGACARIVLAPLYGRLADRTRDPRRWLALVAGTAAAAVASIALLQNQAAIVCALTLHAMAVVPVLPMAEAATLAHLGERAATYGRIRLWGSIGFIVTAAGGAPLFRHGGLSWVPVLIAACWAVIAGLALMLPLTAPSDQPAPIDRESAASTFPWRAMLPVLLAAGLGAASNGPYYALFTLQMKARDVSEVATGLLWAWGVVAEIALMAAAPALLARWRLSSALRWALVLSCARWLLFATQPSLGWIVAGQALHAASFGLLHLASVQLVGSLTPIAFRHRGQAWLSVATGGLGSVVGLLVAGQLAEWNLQTWPYAGAALLAAAGLACALRIER